MKEYQGWSEFESKFKPKKNHLSKHDVMYYETYGEELDYIQSIDPKYVWTWVQGDMSDLLVAGVAYVNRLNYIVCEVPWQDEMDTVLLSVEEECACYDEDTCEGKDDCDNCEGYGYVTRYVD